MPAKKRASPSPSRRKRATTPASSAPALDPLSPLGVFRASVPAGVPATLTREALLAAEPCEVISEHGISFDGTHWWSAELRPYVSLPPAARKRPLAMEIRWDAAERSRRQLTSITLMLRDEHGRVVKTISCRHRSLEQLTESREKDRAARDEYEKSIKQQRTKIQLRATARFAGAAAGSAHADLIASPTPPTTASEDNTDDLAAPSSRGQVPATSPRPTRPRGRARKKGAAARTTPQTTPSGSGRPSPARRAAVVPPPPVAPQPTAARKGASFAAIAHTLAGGKPPARRRS